MPVPQNKKNNSKYELLTILGPTATGKTRIGVKLATELNGEIISADSRQVYRNMDIGTGKDLSEYTVDNISIPYHLIDIADPTEEYNIFRFKSDFYETFKIIREKEKLPILVGGTGLYLSVVLQNYSLQKADFPEARKEELKEKTPDELRSILLSLKPEQHNTTDLLDKNRMIKAIQIEESVENKNKKEKAISSLTIGIKPETDELKAGITRRLKKRLEEGMIDEVRSLLKIGVTHDKLKFFGLEYKFISLYLCGELNYNDMYQKLNSAIHSFAKRQMTWFRKMERENVAINWFNGKDFNQILSFIKEHLGENARTSG